MTDQYRVLKGIDVDELDGLVAGHWEPGDVVGTFTDQQVADLLSVGAIEVVDPNAPAPVEPVQVPAPEIEPVPADASELETPETEETGS